MWLPFQAGQRDVRNRAAIFERWTIRAGIRFPESQGCALGIDVEFVSFASEVHPAVGGPVGFVLSIPRTIEGDVGAGKAIAASSAGQAKGDFTATQQNLTGTIRRGINLKSYAGVITRALD